jgi:hypothetical protein
MADRNIFTLIQIQDIAAFSIELNLKIKLFFIIKVTDLFRELDIKTNKISERV